MYESTATLYKATITQDAALNEVTTYTGREVYVRKTRSIYANEFYQAASQGMKPAAVLTVFFGDYEGEEVVGWKGKTYRVTRIYQRPDSDDMELTVEEDLRLRLTFEDESE